VRREKEEERKAEKMEEYGDEREALLASIPRGWRGGERLKTMVSERGRKKKGNLDGHNLSKETFRKGCGVMFSQGRRVIYRAAGTVRKRLGKKGLQESYMDKI